MLRELSFVVILAAACACAGEAATVDESDTPIPSRTSLADVPTSDLTAIAAPTPQATMKMRVAGAGDCLNVRSTPSRSSDVLTCLADGTEVIALGVTREAEGYLWRQLENPSGWAVEDWLKPLGADVRMGWRCVTGAGRSPYYFTFTQPDQRGCTPMTVAEFEAFRAERDALNNRNSDDVFPRDHDSYEGLPPATPTPAIPTPASSQQPSPPAPYVPPSPPQAPTPACVKPPTQPLLEPKQPVSPPSEYQPVITLSKTVGRPGDVVSVYGYDFPPSGTVVFYGSGQLLTGVDGGIAGVTTDKGGNFSFTSKVPLGLCPGTYVIQAVAIDTGLMASASFTVAP